MWLACVAVFYLKSEKAEHEAVFSGICCVAFDIFARHFCRISALISSLAPLCCTGDLCLLFAKTTDRSVLCWLMLWSFTCQQRSIKVSSSSVVVTLTSTQWSTIHKKTSRISWLRRKMWIFRFCGRAGLGACGLFENTPERHSGGQLKQFKHLNHNSIHFVITSAAIVWCSQWYVVILLSPVKGIVWHFAK